MIEQSEKKSEKQGLPAGVNPFVIVEDEYVDGDFDVWWPDYFFKLRPMYSQGSSVIYVNSRPNVRALSQKEAERLVQTIFSKQKPGSFAIDKQHVWIVGHLWPFIRVVDPAKVRNGRCRTRDCYYLNEEP